MSLIKSLLGGPKRGPAQLGPSDSLWGLWPFTLERSGITGPITQEVAQKLSVVWRCRAVLAEGVASLPCIIYKRREDGGKDRWPQHPVYGLLHGKPNVWQTSFEWFELGMTCLLFRGNFVNWIRPGPRGPVDQLWPIDPDRVTPEQQEDGSIDYLVRRSGGDQLRLKDDEVFHVKGPSQDGIWGTGILDQAAEALRAGLTQQQFASRYFTQTPQPGGVLETPTRLSDPAYEKLVKRWSEAYSGANTGNPALLEEGLKYTPFQVGLTAEQAQLVASREFTVSDVARWFGVPNHLVGAEVASSWGTGIEQMEIGFLTHTILGWLRRFETRVSTDLIFASDTYFAEFLVDGLLRADAKTRSEALAIQRTWGVLSTNEWRALENRNPVPGGDDYLIPSGAQIRGADGRLVPPPSATPAPTAPADMPAMGEGEMEPAMPKPAPSGRAAARG